MNKKALTETDIRSKFITPAIVGGEAWAALHPDEPAIPAKWDLMSQVLEEHCTRGQCSARTA